MLSLFKVALATLPVDSLLECAASFSHDLISLKKHSKEKEIGQMVTEADFALQRIIIEHIRKTIGSEGYGIYSEEEIPEDLRTNGSLDGWCLIIDPLDGTSCFQEGDREWGIMVGVRSPVGEIVLSWNLLSTGFVYASGFGHDCDTSLLPSMIQPVPLTAKKKITIDVWDYGQGAAERFPEVFSACLPPGTPPVDVAVTSIPSAVWVGAALCRGELDGIMWLPSPLGKRSYPTYDLIYLSALVSRGWWVRLGSKNQAAGSAITNNDGRVWCVLVAQTEASINLLQKCAMSFSATPSAVDDDQGFNAEEFVWTTTAGNARLRLK